VKEIRSITTDSLLEGCRRGNHVDRISAVSCSIIVSIVRSPADVRLLSERRLSERTGYLADARCDSAHKPRRQAVRLFASVELPRREVLE